MALPPKRSHKIPLEQAVALTRRRRADMIKGGFFFRDELDELLAQPGCAGIRIYFGRDDKSADGVIVVGVDQDGKDMTGGTVMDVIIPCPPFCDDGSALL